MHTIFTQFGETVKQQTVLLIIIAIGTCTGLVTQDEPFTDQIQVTMPPIKALEEEIELVGSNIRSLDEEIALDIKKLGKRYFGVEMDAMTQVKTIAKKTKTPVRSVSAYFRRTFPATADYVSKTLTIGELAFRNIMGNNKKVLVKFFSRTCPICKVAKPVVQELAEKYENEIVVVSMDMDKYPYLVQEQLNVRKVPTFMFYINAQKVYEEIGFSSKEDLVTRIQEHFNILF